MKWQFWVKFALHVAGDFLTRCVAAAVVVGWLWADGYLYWPPDLLSLVVLGFVLLCLFSSDRKKWQKQAHTEPGPAARIFGLVFWAGLGIGLPVFMMLKGAPPLAALFVLLLFLGFSWLLHACQPRTPEKLVSIQSLPDADRPEISQDALVYRFTKITQTGAVYVDHARRMLHFYNCHNQQKFFHLYPHRWFSCAVDELQSVDESEALVVNTTSGRARIYNTGDGYEKLRDTIKELV
jgi:hypothetical protein